MYLKVRHIHRIANETVVHAIGARGTGELEIQGFSVGMSKEEALQKKLLCGLIHWGLKGGQLVTSDAHEGLKAAISQVPAGATQRRCRVHFMRNLLTHVPQGDKAMVAAAVRTIFVKANHQAARRKLAEAVRAMHTRWPKKTS